MGFRWENGTIVSFEDEPNPIQEAEEARAKAYRERGRPAIVSAPTHSDSAAYLEHVKTLTEALRGRDY